MNIVYLIGNGFDKRLGLKTGYPEFLEAYKQTTPEDEQVRPWKNQFFAFIERIQKEKKDNLWCDLEVALGAFTEKFGEDAEAFTLFYRDLNNSLIEYLNGIQSEEKEQLSQVEIANFQEDLYFPWKYLRNEKQKEDLSNALSIMESRDISVITFNYTNSFEYLCNQAFLSLDAPYKTPNEFNSYCLRKIVHVHRELTDDGVLFGVDSTEQINNEYFRKNKDMLDLLVKPDCNDNVIGMKTNAVCKNIIACANLICIFGSSLGETDRTWWTSIRKRLQTNSNVVVIYFRYTPTEQGKHRVLGHELGRIERQARREVLTALGINDDESTYDRRIFIASNTEMFPRR